MLDHNTTRSYIDTMKVQIKNNNNIPLLPSETSIGTVYKRAKEFYLRIHDTSELYKDGYPFVRFNKTTTTVPTLVWLFDRNYYDLLTKVGEPTLSV